MSESAWRLAFLLFGKFHCWIWKLFLFEIPVAKPPAMNLFCSSSSFQSVNVISMSLNKTLENHVGEKTPGKECLNQRS
jgi:hypothetical protein